MRAFAWLCLIILLLSISMWIASNYRAVRLQAVVNHRRLALVLMPQSIGFEQVKPPPAGDGLKLALQPNDNLAFQFAVATVDVRLPAPGVQVFRAQGLTPLRFVTVVMIRWWWLIVPLSLLTSLVWVTNRARGTKARGFAVERQSAASTDASR